MSFSTPRPGQCIFCAFRLQSRQLLRLPVRQTASLSTSSGQSRNKRRDKDDHNPPSFFIRGRDGVRRRPRDRPSRSEKSPRQSFIIQYSNTKKESWRVILLRRLEEIESDLRDSPVMSGLPQEDIDRSITKFVQYAGSLAISSTIVQPHRESETWRKAFIERGEAGLDAQLKYAFYGQVLGQKFTKIDIDNQKAVADLRYPLEWYPSARSIQRTVHVHIGPTNSGKTYHALKRLEQAKSGVYAGPLRLLAHEIYTRMNSLGKTCALVTGEEQRTPKEWAESTTKLVSCTVEMCPNGADMEVAVIDEIQMLGNDDRGWAWTQAFTGVRASEVHVCGEERALPLIEKLAASMGDELIVHRYERLTSLQVEPESLRGDFKKLRKGDCVVAFSVMAIHALRSQIEKITGKRVAVIYGSLPPETRAAQARLFNDPNNDYDILVASDAIGMGLNLSIKRVIFDSIQKHNGVRVVTLTVPELKQIAGRAGRYRTALQSTEPITSTPSEVDNATATPTDTAEECNVSPAPPLESRPPFDKHTIGLVTTLEQEDYPTVARALDSSSPPLTTAGLLPTDIVVSRFCSYFPPGTPFSYILMRLHELSQTASHFHLCNLKDQVAIADCIHDVSLDVGDRLMLCSAPVNMRDKKLVSVTKELATCVAGQTGGALLDLETINFGILEREVEGSRTFLKELEVLHKSLILYLWLSFRFPGVFTTRPLANYTKVLVEDAIEKCLRMLSYKDMAKARRKMRERSVLATMSEDIVRQTVSEDSETNELDHRDMVLERQLDTAADQLGDEGIMDIEKEAKGARILNDTAISEIPLVDEGEYLEEEDEEKDVQEEKEEEQAGRGKEIISDWSLPFKTSQTSQIFHNVAHADTKANSPIAEEHISAPMTQNEDSTITNSNVTEEDVGVSATESKASPASTLFSSTIAENDAGTFFAKTEELSSASPQDDNPMTPSVLIPLKSVQSTSSDDLATLIRQQQKNVRV